MMKCISSIFLFLSMNASAQFDSIYVHLYTDSLKKGTFNYINIDGLSKGIYQPLDSTIIAFECSYGQFYGNNLWIPDSQYYGKVRIRASVKNQPSLYKEFFLYIKKEGDPPLKTEKELLEEMKLKSKKKKA